MKARIVLVVSLVAACSDQSDDISERSGVPDKSVHTLSEEDARKLCPWIAPILDEATDHALICLRSALGATQTQQACDAAYAACMAEPPPAKIACDDVSGFRAGCLTVVNQLEDCVLDGREQTRTLKQTLSCASAGQPLQADNPATCTSIMPECFP